MSESVFWGAIVKPGKSSPFVPPPEDAALHISQAVLDPSTKAGARAWLKCKVQDGPEMVVAALREGATEMQSLDLVFDQYTEFSVQGTASVHLTGYLMPEREEGGPEGDDDEDDDEDEGGFGEQMGLPEGMTMEQFKQALQDGRISGMGGDDDDSEDDDDDDDDEDGMGANGFGEESDEDIETSDYDSEEEEDVRTKSQVVIEEEEPAEPSAVAKAAQQKRKADKQALEPPTAKRAAKQPEAAVAKKATPAPKAEQKLAAAQTPEAKTPKAVAEAKTPAPVTTGRKNVKRFENGFEIETTAIGQADGKLAKGGKRVQVKYIGRLKSNNKVFDQTKGNKTFAFRLGVGEVIKGWDRGVEGMRVGDKRRLTVPASMGYGSSGAPPSIPPNATLIFDVELCNVL